MATIFIMNEEIARGMVCFFHQKKHSYLIVQYLFSIGIISMYCMYVGID
jgi:hypothetical protein